MMGIWHATAVRTLSMCYVWLSAGITVAGVFDIMPRHLGSAESFIVGMKGFAGKDVSFRNIFGSTSVAILKPLPLPLTIFLRQSLCLLGQTPGVRRTMGKVLNKTSQMRSTSVLSPPSRHDSITYYHIGYCGHSGNVAACVFG